MVLLERSDECLVLLHKRLVLLDEILVVLVDEILQVQLQVPKRCVQRLMLILHLLLGVNGH